MFRRLILALLALMPMGALAQTPPVNGMLIQYQNDGTTGTTANTVTTLTSAGNAIKYPHLQSVGVVGVAMFGAGTVGAVYVQQVGVVPIIADGAVGVQHWVVPSSTTDGQIHDTGTACTALPPSGIDVIGCSSGASTGSGITALVSLRIQISASGIAGTASTNCNIKGSGTNTIGCGAGTDTGTYFLVGEILDVQTNPIAIENTTAAGTYTVSKLACVTASNTVGDCTTAAQNSSFVGVNLAKNGTTPVTQISGKATVTSTSSVIFTQGDYVCTDGSNAATVVDNGTTGCPQGQREVGITVATDGGNSTTHTVILQFGSNGTQTIASGSSALNTAAITTASCNTTTVSATGVASTDTIIANFNGSPIAITGYVPSTNGTLYIYPYPTTNNVNFQVCNNGTGTVTPGSATINWRDLR